MIDSICPYLGMEEDAETALAFPSATNCCYREGKPLPVSFSIQRNYCLTTAYVGCPTYLHQTPPPSDNRPGAIEKPKPAGKPGAQRTPPAARQRAVSNRTLIGLVVLLALLLTVGGVVWGKTLFGEGLGQPGFLAGLFGEATASPTVRAVVRTTLTPLPGTSTPPRVVLWTQTATQKAAKTTLTPTGSPSGSSTPTRAAKTQESTTAASTPTATVCGAPGGWVFYTVRQGDTLSSLSRVFGVPVAQLQTANCMGSSTQLYAGSQIYAPSAYPTNVPPTPTRTLVSPSDTPKPPRPTLTNTPVAENTATLATTPAPTLTLPAEPTLTEIPE